MVKPLLLAVFGKHTFLEAFVECVCCLLAPALQSYRTVFVRCVFPPSVAQQPLHFF